jgi:hypothetical protein
MDPALEISPGIACACMVRPRLFCLDFQCSDDVRGFKPQTLIFPCSHQAIELEVDRIRCFIKLLHMVAARPQIMDDLRQCTAANIAECADAVSDIRDSKVSSLACPCASPQHLHAAAPRLWPLERACSCNVSAQNLARLWREHEAAHSHSSAASDAQSRIHYLGS